MDILKISEDSLKVMLTAEDMTAYNIDCEVMAQNREYSVTVLRTILRDAGDACGFSSIGARFFVQLYAAPKGECEIFVRRLPEIGMSTVDYRRDPKELCTLSAVAGHGVFVYSFDEMAPMMQACKRLRIARYIGESTAYREDGGRLYYLVLEERSPLPEEHGGKFCNKNTAYYINEHCSVICEGAVEVLGSLA